MHKVDSVAHYFETLGDRFVAEASAGVSAVFQYELGGPTGGTWHVVVSDGTMALNDGAHDKPTVTIKMKDADYINMVNGTLKGPMAYMTGKLKVKGSIPMAQKMQKIFPPAA
jgi:putative sterol carrier protein